MKNLKYYIVYITMFFCGANLACADVIINEVQLDPTEERFIELYNSSSSSVDLTDWYIQRKTATGSTFGSLVTKTSFEGKEISSHGYFLISKSSMDNADIVIDNLTITESNTIQIKNGAGDVVDKVGWGDATDCGSSCAPNPTSGKSIQKISNGSFVVAVHTPRAINVESGNDTNNDEEYVDDQGDNLISSSSSNSSNDVPEILKITTKIILPKTAVAGIPISVNSLTTTNRGEIYTVGNFVWNFGDGMVMKTKDAGPFPYLYEYPGEYAVTLSYFDSYLNKTADATSKVNIKIVPSEIYISSVGDMTDPFIEIENKSNYEIIISDWVVTGGNHYFIIPEGTTILSGKKIKLSPKITGFLAEDLISVNIANKNKDIIATYPVQTKKTIQKNTSSVKTSSNNFVPEENVVKDDSQIINLNNLGASAKETGINIPNSVYPVLGLLGVIGIGIASFLMIKRKNNIPDYIEKDIRAEDMKIIE